MLDSHTTVLDTITNHLFPSRRGMNRRPVVTTAFTIGCSMLQHVLPRPKPPQSFGGEGEDIRIPPSQARKIPQAPEPTVPVHPNKLASPCQWRSNVNPLTICILHLQLRSGQYGICGDRHIIYMDGDRKLEVHKLVRAIGSFAPRLLRMLELSAGSRWLFTEFEDRRSNFVPV